MNGVATALIASYVDALRPIIYIKHFDFEVIDKLISEIADDAIIYEYNNADGYVDFHTKQCKHKYDLKQFLGLIDDADATEKRFVVLKEVVNQFENAEILARLRSIAMKQLYHKNFDVSIFIVSCRLIIPPELDQFVTVCDIPRPNEGEISTIIRKFAAEQEIRITKDVEDELCFSFKGLNEFEITQILNLAYQDGGRVDKTDKALILQEKEQIIKKSGMVEIVNFSETMTEIGGLENLKSWLSSKAKVFKELEKATKFGVDIPKGIMIVGMPGCGKTLVAKATAKLFEIPLLRLDVGRLFGKYVGESEENMRRALLTAEAVSPCVLWIDEIEKAFSGIGESGGGNGVTTRLFGHFLTWLQEKESTVFVVATANDISKLPAEFLRKGRFDELFSVELPNEHERRQIFEIHLRKRGKYNKDIDTIRLIKGTQGFNGADIESVVKETIELAFINGRHAVTTADLLAVIGTIKSFSVTCKDKVSEIKQAMEKFDIKPASIGFIPKM